MLGRRGSNPRRRGRYLSVTSSDVETEMHHVAIAHDVVAPFNGLLARFAALRFAAELDEVFPPNHFSFDEAALEVGVNHAGGLRRRRAFAHGPGAHLLLARREVRDETQELVTRSDHGVEARLGETDAGQKVRAVSR